MQCGVMPSFAGLAVKQPGRVLGKHEAARLICHYAPDRM